MSAPDVNVEKQKHRHRTMVRGLWIGLAVIVVVTFGMVLASSLFHVDLTALIPAEPEVAG